MRKATGRLHSHALQFMQRAFVDDIPCVQRGCRLKEDHPAFFVSHGTMLDSPGNDNELAFLQPHLPVAELHPEAAFRHQEHLVFLVMMVPDELALEFAELHHLAIEFSREVRFPGVLNLRELLSNVYFFHVLPQRNLHPLLCLQAAMIYRCTGKRAASCCHALSLGRVSYPGIAVLQELCPAENRT